MKAIMIMFDSLNRHMLPPYGCEWVHMPNFCRLYEHSVKFDRCYSGSLPCMPARRELHTGRYNFLHRSWSPIEPYDDSAIEMMGERGIYTHLISDHVHYWEDGGATYHTRYSSFEFFRGQEGDKWKGIVKDPEKYENSSQKCLLGRANAVNRMFMQEEKDHSQFKVFEAAEQFIDMNHDSDRWFLQIEPFDPHEPFYTYEKYYRLYQENYRKELSDWPDYGKNHYTGEMAEHLRISYAALLSMCDHYLGKILNKMDAYGLWEDTMLIVNTDHGFLLGEHDYWGKNSMPFYSETSHIPLFIWDPRYKKQKELRNALVQTIDLPVTLLEFFGIRPTPDMKGKNLAGVIEKDENVREGALFGIYGGHVCCTDGDYIYMKGAASWENKPLYQYTLMPVHMMGRFCEDELSTAVLSPPFSFSKGIKLLRTECRPWGEEKGFAYGLGGYMYPDHITEDFLFDVRNGKDQEICDTKIQERMKKLLIRLMKENDAPKEQYERLGLE